MAFRSEDNGSILEEHTLKFKLPKLDKHMIENIDDEESIDSNLSIKFIFHFLDREMVEQEMREWVDQFLEEVDRIENFFVSKLEEYT